MQDMMPQGEMQRSVVSNSELTRCADTQIGRRRRAHQEKHPDAKIISLGIGDTTEPIPKSIAEAMQQAAAGMATLEGYSG